MSSRLIPADWMPHVATGRLSRCIVHWTAGAGQPSPEDLASYHILISRDGLPHRGEHSITDNLSTSDGDYAAHTRGLNTGSIGLALCGMAGAEESPFKPGPYPLTKKQWNAALLAAADLCRRYGILPDERSLLMHCEVQSVWGIPPRGKWDVARLPFNRGKYETLTPGEELRARVKLLLEEK